MIENQGMMDVLNKIASIVKSQSESSENIFRSQVEVINKQVDIINRQVDIIEKQHNDNVLLINRILEMSDKKQNG